MKYNRLCANCGKETDNLIDNLCESCYKKIKEKIYSIKRIKICKKCGKMYYKNRIVKPEKIEAVKFEKEYFICERCKKLYSNDYNIILQIRNLAKQDIENIINYIDKKNVLIRKINYIDLNSLDIYVFLEKNILKKYIKFLKRSGFSIKISKKLKTYDSQHGKKIYILTLLIRR